MIDIFHFIRILNLITHRKLSKIFEILQKIGIYSDLIQAKSTFVVSLWRHDVTWKSGCFSAPERGDFLKNSGILQLYLTSTISSSIKSTFDLISLSMHPFKPPGARSIVSNFLYIDPTSKIALSIQSNNRPVKLRQ